MGNVNAKKSRQDKQRDPEVYIDTRAGGAMGAPPVAELSDLSEWQRSAGRKPA